MAEIDDATWQVLDNKEMNLELAKFLKILNEINNKNQNVEGLKRCIRLLQEEFLIDCLKKDERDDERDAHKIKRDIRDAFSVKSSVAAKNAFVFGAGISKNEPFNIPGWSELLQRIHSNFFTERYGRCIGEGDIRKTLGETDLYEMAQYLESILSEDNVREYGEQFRTKTYNRLFSMVENALYYKSLNSSKLADERLKNSLIRYLATLAMKYNIQRILTYNYDDCFEGTYLTLPIKGKGKITPIFVDEQLPYADEAKAKRVYHVHGLIPKYYDYNQKFINGKTYMEWLRSAESRHIVLTEDSYEEIANSNYKWRNTVQADTFVRYNCFIFGFSASDRNFKRLTRLIDWHQNEITGPLISQPVKHYIFLTIDEYLAGIFPNNKLNIDMETLVTKLQFLYYMLRNKRKYLRRFHIYPIWTTILDLEDRIESIIK